jgi:2-methylfumaryl-CoA hydratase
VPTHNVDGPYFEDFSSGQQFFAPAVTITSGHTAYYQAVCGDRLLLPLDKELSYRVTGNSNALVHPMLVINIVNGQTTYASQHVKGNLFYRGLVLKEPVFVGDTLTTITTVVRLKQNKPKPSRAATGMVVLEMETKNQNGNVVMKYWRCPMIPCRDPSAETGLDDDFDGIPERLNDNQLDDAVPESWDYGQMKDSSLGSPIPQELVRLTGNIAFAHTDASKSYLGKRLVYGGHTISVALSQVIRAIPNAVTLLGWQSCDHLSPVLEEDLVRTEFVLKKKREIQVSADIFEIEVDSWTQRFSEKTGTYVEEHALNWKLVLLVL